MQRQPSSSGTVLGPTQIAPQSQAATYSYCRGPEVRPNEMMIPQQQPRRVDSFQFCAPTGVEASPRKQAPVISSVIVQPPVSISSSSSGISQPSDRYVHLHCAPAPPPPTVSQYRQGPRYQYVSDPNMTVAPPSQAQVIYPPARPPPTLVSGPIAPDEKPKLLAYLNNIEQPTRETSSDYYNPALQPVKQPPPMSTLLQPATKSNAVFNPINSNESYPSQSQSLQSLNRPQQPPKDDVYRNSKVTIIDPVLPTDANPTSPPVYPSYKHPVLPPVISAYVNPDTGVVTTLEAMIVDAPDSRILEPPPLGDLNTDLSPEYRINKVCLCARARASVLCVSVRVLVCVFLYHSKFFSIFSLTYFSLYSYFVVFN